MLDRSVDGLYSYCKECVREISKNNYMANKDYYKNRNKKYYQVKKSECNARSFEWRKKNPERAREIQRRHDRKIRSSPIGRISENISSEISRSMNRGPRGRGHWEDLVGYTKAQLKAHLEKQFTDEMSWENYGEWHIDHKVPLSAFNITSPGDLDFKRAWALSNLQPLMALENIKKRTKLDRPFQPALAIAV
jgi:hypothetical protein